MHADHAIKLSLFTPLAGNLTTASSGEDVFVDCSPDSVSLGVRFVEAKYAGDMRLLASDAGHDVEAFVQLVPDLPRGRLPAPVLAVQVTRPSQADSSSGAGIVAVSAAVHHAVVDGQALWQFLRTWAAASRRRPSTALRLINRRPNAEVVARKFVRVFAPALPTVNADQMYYSPVRSSVTVGGCHNSKVDNQTNQSPSL
jgi:hypothetical protein